MSNKIVEDEEILRNIAWNMIEKLDTCKQGHIISHKDVVDCMIKFVKEVTNE